MEPNILQHNVPIGSLYASKSIRDDKSFLLQKIAIF